MGARRGSQRTPRAESRKSVAHVCASAGVPASEQRNLCRGTLGDKTGGQRETNVGQGATCRRLQPPLSLSPCLRLARFPAISPSVGRVAAAPSPRPSALDTPPFLLFKTLVWLHGPLSRLSEVLIRAGERPSGFSPSPCMEILPGKTQTQKTQTIRPTGGQRGRPGGGGRRQCPGRTEKWKHGCVQRPF